MIVSSLALLLAQACVAEIDLGSRPEASENTECALMWAVLDKRAIQSQRTLEYVTKAYVQAFICAKKHKCDTARFRMIRSFNAEGTKPKRWDARSGPWELDRNRGRWLRRLQAAEDWLQARGFPETATASCRRADHFGGPCGRAGACDCWLKLNCGHTLQTYWKERACIQVD